MDSFDQHVPGGAMRAKKRKGHVHKRLRLTNTHLEGIDLSKDYEPPPTAP